MEEKLPGMRKADCECDWGIESVVAPNTQTGGTITRCLSVVCVLICCCSWWGINMLVQELLDLIDFFIHSGKRLDRAD